jgi:hypothetical protein
LVKGEGMQSTGNWSNPKDWQGGGDIYIYIFFSEILRNIKVTKVQSYKKLKN